MQIICSKLQAYRVMGDHENTSAAVVHSRSLLVSFDEPPYLSHDLPKKANQKERLQQNLLHKVHGIVK